MALDRSVLLAFSRSASRRSRVRSVDFPGEVTFDLDRIPPAEPGSWGNYTRGAALGLVGRHGIQRGVDGLVRGSLPVGGVSSSAAVGVAYLLAYERANGLELDRVENVELDRFIENSYVGLQNGILDQSVILLSHRDELLHLDCGTRRHESLRFGGDPSRFRVLLAHSGLGRVLISTDYNKHVGECREAARALLESAGEHVPETPLLGLVPREAFEARHKVLPDSLKKRAMHFFSETARVEAGLEAWKSGDLEQFGDLMNESCLSSIHNYRCGCPELITLFEILSSLPGVYGSRFSGAGYGGCCIALVDPRFAEDIAGSVGEEYVAKYPERREGFASYLCGTADGACVL